MPADKETTCPSCGLALDTLVLAIAVATARCPACDTDMTEHAHVAGRTRAPEWPWEEGPLLVMEEAEAYPPLDEYHEEEANVRFRYPSGWVVERRKDRVIIRPPDAAHMPELLETSGYAVAITFATSRPHQPAGGPLGQLQEFVATRLLFFAQRHLLWQRRLTLPGGHPALAYCLDYMEHGHSCRVIAAAAARDNRLFFLDVAGLRPDIEALDQTCKRIVTSLTL